MSGLVKLYDKLLQWLGLLPGIFVATIAVGTCADVLLRNLGSSGLYGMLEIIEYSLLVLTMAGAGYTMRIGRHVTVDILAENLPPRFARLVAIIATVLATIFSATFFWYGLLAAVAAYQSGATIQKAFFIPEWLPIAVVPFGFFFLTVELIRRLYLMAVSADLRHSRGAGRDGGL